MVKHIVLWNFVAELSDAEKTAAGNKMKELLEPIKELVPGTVEIQVISNQLSSSNRDIALVSTFETWRHWQLTRIILLMWRQENM